MFNIREFILGMSGGYFLIGALGFIFGSGPTGSGMMTFGIFSSIGAILMLIGLMMDGYVNPRGIRRAAIFVIVAGAMMFLTSAMSRWDPMEPLILATCGSYGAIMVLLSKRLQMN